MRYPLPLMHIRHDIMFLKNFPKAFALRFILTAHIIAEPFSNHHARNWRVFSLTIGMIFRFHCSTVLLTCGFSFKYTLYQTVFEQNLPFTDHATPWRALGEILFLASLHTTSRCYAKPSSGTSASGSPSEVPIGYQTKPPFVSVVNPTLYSLMWGFSHTLFSTSSEWLSIPLKNAKKILYRIFTPYSTH